MIATETMPSPTQGRDGMPFLACYRKRLSDLVNQGGPHPGQHPAMDALWDAAASQIETERLSWEDIRQVWGEFEPSQSRDCICGSVGRKNHADLEDCEVTDRIYCRWISRKPHLANWDHYFHGLPIARAMCSRRRYFHDWLASWEKKVSTQPIRVLDIGCGPARDVAEYFEQYPGSRAVIECVDANDEAITYAHSVCADYRDRVEFHRANPFRYQPAQPPLLVWCANLFDRLADKFCVRLLERYYWYLAPEGEIVAGNFSSVNTHHNWMKVLGWEPHSRDRTELEDFIAECDIRAERAYVVRGTGGLNLFLHIAAPAVARFNVCDRPVENAVEPDDVARALATNAA